MCHRYRATEPTGEPGQADGAALSGRPAEVLAGYRAALVSADLSEHARRSYASRVAGFLDRLAAEPDLVAGGEPLSVPHARDYAVRDYRSWLITSASAPQ